jgi:hypothetical protein
MDVGSARRKPFLVENHGSATGKYATLSYCWGATQSLALTTEMIKPRIFMSKRSSFSMNALPPTLRDAITICRKLGIQYIWIDALCIVQDSPVGEDWQRESSVMDQIYGNAEIRIAASAASDTSKGVLRPPSELRSGVRSVPYTIIRDMKRYDGTVSAQFYPYDVDDQQPLSSRAWAFQEYLLSPRLLAYQGKQLAWECATKKVYANWPTNIERIKKIQRTERRWEDFVEYFTRCHLTFDEDRLAALAGYAKSSDTSASLEQAARGSPANEYLAGIWVSQVTEHLLWYIKDATPRARPADYRAPT